MKNLLFLLAMLAMPIAARANLKIVTTTTDYADLARQIGGDKVEVHSIMKGPENVQNVMAKPTEMVYLNQADLFVHSGLDTEPWRDNLLRGARNPKVNQGQSGWVDMSTGIKLKDVPTGQIDRSMGDVHAYGNPHFTLNPQNAQRMAVTLTKAMIKNDPANAARPTTSASLPECSLTARPTSLGELRTDPVHLRPQLQAHDLAVPLLDLDPGRYLLLQRPERAGDRDARRLDRDAHAVGDRDGCVADTTHSLTR